MGSLRKLTTEVNFGGGVNKDVSPSMIADNESPDMLNMVVDEEGASFGRNGTSRYNAQVIFGGFPIRGLYRAYKNDSSTKVMIAACNTNLYKGTDATGVMTSIKGSLTADKEMYFCMMNNLVICTNLSDTPFSYNLDATCTDLGGTPPKAQYCVVHKNYLIMGNCNYSATAYPSRIWYSAVADPDTWGASNYINIRTDDGGIITGLGSMGGVLHVFKTNSIHGITGDFFHATTGDMSVDCIADGVGCIAPRSLVNTGSYYIFLAQDGIRIFDGGSSKLISGGVQKILNDIPAATRAKCAGGYDKKNNWYWFSYEDPSNLPDGKVNSILIYDLNYGVWYPCDGINANVFCCWDGAIDANEFYYGDINQGFIARLDNVYYKDDAPLEKTIATMESSESWAGDDAADTTNYKEGLQGLTLTCTNATTKTMTLTKSIDLSIFDNGVNSSINDYIQVKIYHGTRANIQGITIDFNGGGYIYTNKTPDELGLTAGNNQWTTVNIPKSSFTDGTTQQIPFKSITSVAISQFGFDTPSPVGTSVTFDDLRLVQSTRNPINAYRFTKEYDLKRPEIRKNFKNLYLEFNNNDAQCVVRGYFDWSKKNKVLTSGSLKSNGYIYVMDGTNKRIKLHDRDDLSYYSEQAITPTVPTQIRVDDEHIYFIDNDTSNVLYKYKKSDYSLVGTSTTANGTAYRSLWGFTIDENYIYLPDYAADATNRIVILKKTDLSYVNVITPATIGATRSIAVDDEHVYFVNGNVLYKYDKYTLDLINSIGSTGSGNDQFSTPYGMCLDYLHIYIADWGNHRIVKRLKSDLSYVVQVGSSGSGNDNLDNPRDIACNNIYIYILDTDNKRIVKRYKSDLTYVAKLGSAGTGNNNFASNASGLTLHDIDYWKSTVKRSVSFNIWEQANTIKFKFSNNNSQEDFKLNKISLSYIPMTLK